MRAPAAGADRLKPVDLELFFQVDIRPISEASIPYSGPWDTPEMS